MAPSVDVTLQSHPLQPNMKDEMKKKEAIKRAIKPLQEHEQNEETFLDLNSALMPQTLKARWTKEHYLREVHRARYLNRPAVMFTQPLLEMLTRTPWYVVPLIWLPVSFGLLMAASSMPSSLFFASSLGNMIELALMWVLGVFTWTFFEYVFHRFVFHVDGLWLPDHQAAFVVHFLLHGFHHFLPMDPYRLVMPPVLLVAIWSPVYLLLSFILPKRWLYGANAGGLVGYVAYDLFHYAFHHANLQLKQNRVESNKSLLQLVMEHARARKKVHMAHHYASYVSSFGVTSSFWDRVFGTLSTPNTSSSGLSS